MQHALTCPPPGAAEFGSSPVFNVLIAYEDFETGKLAKRTYDFLVEHLGNECQFDNQMWKFDVLRLPKLRDMAAADAAAADIVVISCRGGDLPQHVRTWIDSWLDMDDGPLAMVALFDAASELPTRSAREYLASIARRGHMEFFAQPNEGTGKRTNPDQSDLNRRALSTLADVIQTELPQSRWNPFE